MLRAERYFGQHSEQREWMMNATTIGFLKWTTVGEAAGLLRWPTLQLSPSEEGRPLGRREHPVRRRLSRPGWRVEGRFGRGVFYFADGNELSSNLPPLTAYALLDVLLHGCALGPQTTQTTRERKDSENTESCSRETRGQGRSRSVRNNLRNNRSDCWCWRRRVWRGHKRLH
jgi:hypothetical protein